MKRQTCIDVSALFLFFAFDCNTSYLFYNVFWSHSNHITRVRKIDSNGKNVFLFSCIQHSYIFCHRCNNKSRTTPSYIDTIARKWTVTILMKPKVKLFPFSFTFSMQDIYLEIFIWKYIFWLSWSVDIFTHDINLLWVWPSFKCFKQNTVNSIFLTKC